jgi:hypothetical protein
LTRWVQGSRPPGNLFHVFLAGDSPVLVEGALANRKKNLALDVEGTAVNNLLRQAKALDNVSACAGLAQRVRSFGRPPKTRILTITISFLRSETLRKALLYLNPWEHIQRGSHEENSCAKCGATRREKQKKSAKLSVRNKTNDNGRKRPARCHESYSLATLHYGRVASNAA